MASGSPSSRRQIAPTVSSACDLAPDGTGAFDEEAHRLGRGQRVERVLALAGESKRAPARRQDAQTTRAREQRPDARRRSEQVLEVVEQQQDVLSVQEARQAVARAEGLRDLRLDELGIGERGQRHPEHAVAERAHQLGGDLQREARLPRPAGPGHGDEA